MVHGMKSTYNKLIDILDINCIDAKPTGYTLPSGINEISDLNLKMLSLLPNEVKKFTGCN